MACKCIENWNLENPPEQHVSVVAIPVQDNSNDIRCLIESSTSFIIPEFCPFCGVRYKEAEAAAPYAPGEPK